MAKCKKKKIKNLCYFRHVDFSKLSPGAPLSYCLPDVRGAVAPRTPTLLLFNIY